MCRKGIPTYLDIRYVISPIDVSYIIIKAYVEKAYLLTGLRYPYLKILGTSIPPLTFPTFGQLSRR